MEDDNYLKDSQMSSSDIEDINDQDEDVDLVEDEDVPPIDDSIAQLTGHSKDVFCLAVSESKRWLASGSEDDTACVWDLDNAEVSEPYMYIRDHGDSVNSVAFNTTSAILATADMSGCIICTELISKTRLCKIEDCSDVEWILWHNLADILFAGATDGLMWMWLIGKNGVQQSKLYSRGGSAACTKGRLLPDSKRLLAVYADGEACLWDLKSGVTLASVQLNSACFSLDVHSTRPWAAIGCEGGTAILLNTETNKIMNTFGTFTKNIDENNEDLTVDVSNSVEVVSFAPEAYPWLAVATSEGQMFIYDVESNTKRHECEHDGHAVVSATWRKTYQQVNNNTASSDTVVQHEQQQSFLPGAVEKTIGEQLQILSICMDGGVRIWNAKSGEPIKVKSCGGYGVYDFCIVERDEIARIFVACSGGAIRVFDF